MWVHFSTLGETLDPLNGHVKFAVGMVHGKFYALRDEKSNSPGQAGCVRWEGVTGETTGAFWLAWD